MKKQHHHAGRVPGRVLLTTALSGAALLSAGQGVAQAAPAAACDASALRLSVLGSPTLDPITANGAGEPCTNSTGLFNPVGLGILSASLVEAQTQATPTVEADARSRVAGVHVGVSGVVAGITGPLLASPSTLLVGVEAQLSTLLGPGGALTTALSPLSLLGLNVVGIDSAQLSLELGATLPAALTASLPDILNASVIEARATATCVAGVPQLRGASQIAGLTVLGTSIDPNAPAGTLLSLDTANLNVGELVNLQALLRSIRIQSTGALAAILGPGQKSLYDVLVNPGGLLGLLNVALLPLGSTIGTILNTVTSVVQPVLDSLQVNLPPGVLRAEVTPLIHANDGTTLTETVLTFNITALSQPILAGEVARARVSTASAGCLPPVVVDPPVVDPPSPEPPVITPPTKAVDPRRPAPIAGIKGATAAQLALKCGSSRVRLLDVHQAGAETYVAGVAMSKYVGLTATIYLLTGNKQVGTTTVRANGTFAARLPLPPRSYIGTNKARYYAVVGGKKTEILKFTRRLETVGVSSAGGKVTFKGRVTLPRSKKQELVEIRQRVTCTQYRQVAKVRPDSKGNFAVTFKAPAGADAAAVYRAQTLVPLSKRSVKPFATYTLPRAINLVR